MRLLCLVLWAGCHRKFLPIFSARPRVNTTNSATPLSFFSWVYFGLIFNKIIRSKYPGWWHNYNYITAAALDAGLIISTIVIFFCITFPGVDIPQWWGNVGVQDTLVSPFPSSSHNYLNANVNRMLPSQHGERRCQKLVHLSGQRRGRGRLFDTKRKLWTSRPWLILFHLHTTVAAYLAICLRATERGLASDVSLQRGSRYHSSLRTTNCEMIY